MKQRPPGRMADRAPGPEGPSPSPPPSPAETWQDWVTIWQSELNALATDREAPQVWARLVEFWAAHARAAGAFLPDGAGGRARSEPPAGAAAAAAAPDAGDAEQRLALERLARRVEELERRLAEFGGYGKG